MKLVSDANVTSPSFTVLLVEHLPTNRELYRHYLEADSSCRYTFLEANSVAEAVRLCETHVVDGVLVGTLLCGISGLEFVQELQMRLEGHSLPVVIVASENDPAVAVRAIKLGAEDYLIQQALTPEQLQFAMRSAIENARLRLQLQHQEERFRVSIENMLDCFGSFSAIRDETGNIVDFRIDYLNKAACENNRMSRDAQIGKRLCELLPAHRETGLFDEYCQVVETGEPLSKESLIYEDDYDGQRLVRAFDIHAAKLDDGFVVSWRDVTDRKRMELTLNQQVLDLQQQHHRLQRLIDTAPIGIGIGTATGEVKVINDEMLRLHGYTREAFERQGMNWRDFTPSDTTPQIDQVMEQLRREGTIPPEEKELVWPDGSRMPIWISGMRWQDGTDEHVAFAVDLTHQKQIEAELRDREKQFNVFVQHAPVGVAMFDREMRYLAVSDRWLTSYGIEGQEIIGRSHYEVFPEMPERWRELHQRCLAGTVEVCEEDPFTNADGSTIWLRWEVRPWYTNTDEVGGLIIFSEVITDRIGTENALRESHNQLINTLESITDAFFSLDESWRFTFVNPQAAKLLKKIPAELVGRTLWEEFPEAVNSEFDHAYRQALAEQVTVQIEAFYPPLDTWFAVRAYPTRNGLAVYFQDVTARKLEEVERERLLQQEQAARAQVQELLQQLGLERNRLEEVLQQMPLGVVIAEVPSGRVQFFNDEAVRIFRHPLRESETVEGYIQYGGFHPDGRRYQPQEYPVARSLLTGEVVTAEELLYQRGDGTETIVSVNSTPIFDPDGQAIAVIGTIEDIAARKQIEEELRQSEERLKLGVRVAGIALAHFDYITNEVTLSPEAAELYGFSPDALTVTREQVHATFHPEERAELLELIEQLTSSTETAWFAHEHRVIRPDGEVRWLNVRKQVFSDCVGEIHRPAYAILAAIDITERKQAEAEREQLLAQAQAAYAEAEAANRSKDEFVSIVAHELRSPLNAILGWARLLQTRSFDAESTAKALETIVRNTEAQTQLVEDLLDVSRMVRGTLPLEFRPVNLSNVVGLAIETVQLSAEAKSLQLQAQIQDVGPVRGDFNRLQQVVLNLLTNAVKFTPAGGQIQILLDQLNSQVRIQISDTGKGIKPDFLPYVFERFRQDQQEGSAKHGLGLGLALVKYIVEQHSGTVSVQSAGEGQGTTFTVLLPRLQPSQEQAETANLPLSAPTSPFLSGVRVLLVDDDFDMLNLTELILEQAGAIVQTASSAASALEQFPSFQPNILLSDLGMPEQDGYDLLRQIRMMQPGGQIPAIALTAYANETHRQDSLEAGFAYHVVKPVEPEELVGLIQRVMQECATWMSDR